MLSDEQLGFFARNGFLHLPGVIAPQICQRLVRKTWEKLPQHWDPEDGRTWQGLVQDSCHAATVDVRRGHLKFQKGDLLQDASVKAGFYPNTRLGTLASQIIGAPIAPIRVRGLYCIVPLREDFTCSTPQVPHIESHPTQLVSLCYLEDVLPGAGGLLVWPGSHRPIYHTMVSRLEFVAAPDHAKVFADWASKEPIEISGQRGDVVIIHHRLLHAPSVNRSERIRFGFLCDYHRADFRDLLTRVPSEDTWEDWPAIRNLSPSIRDAPADYPLGRKAGKVTLQSLFSWRSKAELPSRGAASPELRPEHADYIRKNDASMLARSRRPGDTWICLSDDQSSSTSNKLDPRGSTWEGTSLTVQFDGLAAQSCCYYDFIANGGSNRGPQQIILSGLNREAWLRLVEIKLPFDESEVLLSERLWPGSWKIDVSPTGLHTIEAFE